MDADFWHQRWKASKIGFHRSEPSSLLATHFQALSVTDNGRVFVPLCGKTVDIAWFLSNGIRVASAELSALAIEQLFADLGIEPKITGVGEMKHYGAKDIDIFVGNIFDLTASMLGPVDAIFDRAALVALPEDMRVRYADHLTELTRSAPQLLITYEYDQSLMDGPPFSIAGEALHRRYGASYEISSLASVDVPGGLNEAAAATEDAWLLTPRNVA